MPTRNPPKRPKRMRLRRLRIAVRTVFERFPGVGAPLLRAWRDLKWQAKRRRLNRVAAAAHDVGPMELNHVGIVPTDAIQNRASWEFSFSETLGASIPGDWDLSQDAFMDLDIVDAMRAVLLDGGQWAGTAWYKSVVSGILSGDTRWGCQTEDEFARRCAYVADVFESIRLDGYLSQAELVKRGVIAEARDEVAVAVGRNGELLFADGAHRLAAAKLLGVGRLPVQIAARHPQWLDLRRRVATEVDAMGGQLYQRAMHPDLESFPYAHTCDDRFDMIRAALESEEGALLDIGANWGYFCHQFEDLGFSCLAVESDPESIYYMRLIRDAMRRKFRVSTDSILGNPRATEPRYSVVLALNIFHHFLKTRQEFELFKQLLEHLECDEMFLEPHSVGEPQMFGAFAPLAPEEMVGLVSETCGLSRVKCLGEVADGRSLFQLVR